MGGDCVSAGTGLLGDETPCAVSSSTPSSSTQAALVDDEDAGGGFKGFSILTMASSSVVIAGIELGLYNFGGTALQVGDISLGFQVLQT